MAAADGSDELCVETPVEDCHESSKFSLEAPGKEGVATSDDEDDALGGPPHTSLASLNCFSWLHRIGCEVGVVMEGAWSGMVQ